MPAENVEQVGKDQATPIVDDPETLKTIYEQAGVEPPAIEHEPEERDWEKAYGKLAEGQEALQNRIAELAEAVSQGLSRPAPERIIEREVSRSEPAAPKWRQNLKDEQAQLLQDAIRDTVAPILGEYEKSQLSPTLAYLLRNQETLIENHLVNKYPDEDFGFSALSSEAKAYRQALGGAIDIETAYKHIAFEKTNAALRTVREEHLARAKKTKEEHPMDDTTVGRTSVGDENDVAPDEMRSARSFFGGADPRTGKQRSEGEIRALWLAHKKGSERDKNPFLDVDESPERRTR